MKPFVEGRLPTYHAPAGGFTPGGNCVGVIDSVGKDVWQLAPGQRVVLSSLFTAAENVPNPAQLLIGLTSFGPDSERVQADWPDGTLAEFALFPASSVVPADGFEDMDGAQLAVVSRFVIPYGGLLRGRLAAGETVVVNGADRGLWQRRRSGRPGDGGWAGRRCGPQRRQASRPRTSRRPGGRSSCFVGRCPEGRCCSARRRGWRRGDGLRHGRRREGFRLDPGGPKRASSPRPTLC